MQKESRVTKDQLLIDETILRDYRKRHTILGMAWVDYKKVFMVAYSWFLESLELAHVSTCVIEFVKTSMANWQTELTSCRESLAKLNLRRWIFQGGSLSPLFVICIRQLMYYAKPRQYTYWEERILTIFCLWVTQNCMERVKKKSKGQLYCGGLQCRHRHAIRF